MINFLKNVSFIIVLTVLFLLLFDWLIEIGDIQPLENWLLVC
jgi:hypothetical protein